ncbi:MAG TPA: hypothetical protein PL023_12405 [Thiobacillus sp.]|nr:hypothetical protein [Thiobacillus sp.]
MKTFLTFCTRTLRRMLIAPAAADLASDRVLLAARLPSNCHSSWTSREHNRA